MIASRVARLLDTRVTESSCPNCGKRLDAALSTEGGHKPSPGDITICLDCRHLCAFAEDMGLRELTDDEVVAVAGDKRVLRAMKALGDLGLAVRTARRRA
jgi:hypothetical protein